MSRASRSAGSRPRTGSTSKRYSAAGDSVPTTNLDEELRTVLQKEYNEGVDGKNEAINDVKTVLKEVSQDPIAQTMDKLLPRFLTAASNSGESAVEDGMHLPKLRSRSKNATPRHAKLTARPSARGKSHPRQLTGETVSVPHIPPTTRTDYDNADTRPATSAPRLPQTTTKYSSTSFSFDKYSHASLTGEVSELHQVESSLTSDVTGSGDGDEEEYDEEELPFTENLMEIQKDVDDPEDMWKADIVELTRLKSAPKGSLWGTDSLELKYKEPLWPHQLHLNNILARRTRLTHLVLDGSELRFLRDLGSNLQSLITLSICDCGLKSLDGVYAMPNLRTLIAHKNMIRIPTQCSFLNRLCYLDLSSNPISSFDEFSNLILCGELRILKLHDTPLTAHPNFNKEIKQLVPQLKEIHPTQYDILDELKQIRKQGQQQMREESKQVNDKGKNTMMPSLSYDNVMLDEPKSGIAYQKIPKTKQNLKANLRQQQRREIEDVRLETGEFAQVYMAPKFLQHLEEAMPPPTAQQPTESESQNQHDFDASTVTTAKTHQKEIFQTEERKEKVKQKQ